MREHRLYQVDFLILKYGFGQGDILFGPDGNLRIDRDPKELWAESHPEFYPVKINAAAKEDLLRVPGFGPETVSRILKARAHGLIHRLENLGLRGKRLARARAFVVMD